MRHATWLKSVGASVLALAITFSHAAALYTIGPDGDPTYLPRVLTQLPTTAPMAAAPLATLGDGSIGFNAGLAYNTLDALLYAIGNDSFGVSTLYSMTTSGGSLMAASALGTGFNGGLAYNAGNGKFYAIANDSLANSTLYDISTAGVATALGSIGLGFYGGLTYNADDGKLYAVAGDSFGVQRTLVEIDPATFTPVPLFDLSDGSLGFNGGLAYDDLADLFYVIGNDFGVNSALFSFDLDHAGVVNPIGSSFGQGFLNVGLALGPAVAPPPPPTTVSEPPPLTLVLPFALLALATGRLKRRRAAGSISHR